MPADAKGIRIVRPLNVMGYDDAPHGHVEMYFENVRVPAGNILLGEGRGFEIAQGRLGPGRIHHCMRLIGLAERALELMCKRASSRVAFGKTVASQTVTQERIAEARCKIDMARLLTLKAAWLMDVAGNKVAKNRDRDDQGGRAQHGLPGDRLGHAGARRRRHVRRLPAGLRLCRRAHAALRGRPGRSAPQRDRQVGAGQVRRRKGRRRHACHALLIRASSAGTTR